MEELKIEWRDTTREIHNAIQFLDNYFDNEHADDKTAGHAYHIMKKYMEGLIAVGERLADDGK